MSTVFPGWACGHGRAVSARAGISGAVPGAVWGPLVPVEEEGVTYEVPCEVYEARKILVYRKNGKDLVEEVAIDCDGRYSIKLMPGFYVVDINRIGIDTSSVVPSEVEVRSNITTRLDIDIDPMSML